MIRCPGTGPTFPTGDNITIDQLLTMRSGLFNYTETLELNSAMDTDPQRAWQPDELLALAYKHPPYFAPGQGFHYSNTNTVLLGLIAEKIDGKPLGQLFKERIFEPLGMKGTVFPDLASNSIPEPHPPGLLLRGGQRPDHDESRTPGGHAAGSHRWHARTQRRH